MADTWRTLIARLMAAAPRGPEREKSMAQFESAQWNAVRGKVGGMVFQGSSNGQMMRVRAVPKQPNTAAQIAVRQGFTDASTAWKVLTPTTQAGWSALASQIILKNRLNKPYSPTGRRLYISCFQNCRTAQQAAPTTAPSSVPGVPGVTNFAVAVTPPVTGHPNGQMTVTGGYSIGGYMIIIRATKTYSPDRKYLSAKDFRVLSATSDDSGPPTPDALAALYAGRFGIPVVGAKLSFETFQVDYNGFVGPVARVNVTAGVAAEVASPSEGETAGLKMKKAA